MATVRQAESGTPVTEIRRKLEVIGATFYCSERQFGGMGAHALRELRQLWDENRKLDQVVADVGLH